MEQKFKSLIGFEFQSWFYDADSYYAYLSKLKDGKIENEIKQIVSK